MKKSLRIILIVLGSLIGFVVLVFLFGSLFGGCVAKNYVNKKAPELIGRKTTVDHIGINLFTGHVAIHDLSVMEEDGKELFTEFDTLDLRVSLPKLLTKTVFVKHFTLSGLDTRILQDGNRFNFSSILDRFQKDSAEVEEPKDTTPSPWVISLHNLRLSNGKVYYADVPRGSDFKLNNLNLNVPDFVVGGKDDSDAGLTLAFTDGGTLKVDGSYNTSDNNFNATLDLEKFALDQVKAYVTDRARIEKIEGDLSVHAQAKGNLSHILDMEIAAQANINDVNILDTKHQSVASLKSLNVDLSKLVLSQNLFDISSITLGGLTTQYELFSDSTNTLSRLLIPATSQTDTAQVAEEKPSDSTQAKPLHLHVGHLDLHDINVTYTDHTLPGGFSFPITNLSIKSDDLSTTSTNNAQVFANLPHNGVLMVKWDGDISNWKQNQSLKLNIKNLHLTDLSPYMLAYFGMPFSDGIFSFTSFNTIRNSQLDGKNRIDIYKPTLGDKQTGIKPKLHIPIKAALYILKDKDDKVILDVPIAGNIDNPEFSYMKLVWKTLGNLIVKVATSPARAITGLFTNEDGDVFIAIDSTEQGLSSEQLYQIDKLAEMVKSDENLHLDILLQTRSNDDADTQTNNQRRNAILQHHLTEIGLTESQYTIGIADPDEKLKQDGYKIAINVV